MASFPGIMNLSMYELCCNLCNNSTFDEILCVNSSLKRFYDVLL